MKATGEYIVCAANWYKELPTPVHGVKNINKGIVFSGYGHAQCLHQMVAMTGKRQHEVKEVQGFLTSKNRFVDREEGAEIALKSGQIKELKYHNTRLFSEDLYDRD